MTSLHEQVAKRTGEDLDFVEERGFSPLKALKPLPSAESLLAKWREREWGSPPEEPVTAPPVDRVSLALA